MLKVFISSTSRDLKKFRKVLLDDIGKALEFDKKIANDILDYILEKTYVYDNIMLHNFVDKVIENIGKIYPALFNSN